MNFLPLHIQHPKPSSSNAVLTPNQSPFLHPHLTSPAHQQPAPVHHRTNTPFRPTSTPHALSCPPSPHLSPFPSLPFPLSRPIPSKSTNEPHATERPTTQRTRLSQTDRQTEPPSQRTSTSNSPFPLPNNPYGIVMIQDWKSHYL